jgi:hypothetical protein
MSKLSEAELIAAREQYDREKDPLGEIVRILIAKNVITKADLTTDSLKEKAG